MKNKDYQICKCCVMDTTDEDIVFDENGVCMRCNEYHDRILPEWNHGKGHEQELDNLLTAIKKKGEGKEYDCILGLSGGLDSSYMLHLAVKEWGLRPYVFHIDAGWNLPVAEENIRKLTDKLGVELHIEKMDWNEMREMQLAWFRTGLEMLDAPQDHAFIALIDKLSKELGIKYILNGYNICTEVIADPASWEKGAGPTGDGTYIKDVVKKHCKIPIKKYTYTSGLKHKFINPYIRGVKTVKPLNYVEFTRESMIRTLSEEYGYVSYGQKHFEDLLTKFLEGWWQPTRFGHDMRRPQLSSLVVTGQMTREEALRILDQPPLSEEESKELFAEVAEKLEISEDELMKMHDMTGFKLDPRVKVNEPLGFNDYNKLQMNALAIVSDSGTLPEESSFYLSIGHPIAAVCIRTSTERPEAMEAGDFILAGISTTELLQATDMAIRMKCDGVLGNPCPDYTDENVSMKVVRIIQGYVNVVNKMVWRKD